MWRGDDAERRHLRLGLRDLSACDEVNEGFRRRDSLLPRYCIVNFGENEVVPKQVEIGAGFLPSGRSDQASCAFIEAARPWKTAVTWEEFGWIVKLVWLGRPSAGKFAPLAEGNRVGEVGASGIWDGSRVGGS